MVGSAYGFEAKQFEFLLPCSQIATPQELRCNAQHCCQTRLGMKQKCFVKDNPYLVILF